MQWTKTRGKAEWTADVPHLGEYAIRRTRAHSRQWTLRLDGTRVAKPFNSYEAAQAGAVTDATNRFWKIVCCAAMWMHEHPPANAMKLVDFPLAT